MIECTKYLGTGSEIKDPIHSEGCQNRLSHARFPCTKCLGTGSEIKDLIESKGCQDRFSHARFHCKKYLGTGYEIKDPIHSTGNRTGSHMPDCSAIRIWGPVLR